MNIFSHTIVFICYVVYD